MRVAPKRTNAISYLSSSPRELSI